MDGIHDLGGKHGFGAVEIEESTLAFQHHWQGAIFTIVNSLFFSGVAHNADHFRHAIERIDPISYLSDGYYGRWLGAAENLLVEAGELSQDEITVRAVELGGEKLSRVAARPALALEENLPENIQLDGVSNKDAANELQNSAQEKEAESGANLETAQRATNTTAKFQVGQRVSTILHSVSGHTRLPAYARGKSGEIIACHDVWAFPDTNAHDRGEQPQYLYTVAFDGDVLWGSAGDSKLEVCLDLFEPYLS